MRRHVVTLAGVAVLFVGALSWAGQENPDETKALDESLEAWAAAFNAHDAKALAATYTEDADVIVATGERMKGRAAIEKGYAEFFARNPRVRTKLSVISRVFIKPDVVVEDGEWEESGHSQDGLQARGRFSTVLVKRGGKWLAAHDLGYILASPGGE